MHNLLEIPPSLRIIPTKYNIIVRLWTYAFHILESLRRAAFASPLALEHLQDFIYYESTPTYFTQVLRIRHLVSFITAFISGINYTHRQDPACAGTYRCTGKRYHYRQDLSGAGWHAGICPGLPIMPAIEYAGW